MGILYLVGNSIGNTADLTLRAREILQAADLIVGEEFKTTRRLLSSLDMSPAKVEFVLNEHSRPQVVSELVSHLEQGRNLALIADTGMPVLADPGLQLVQAAGAAGHKIVPIPGVSSALAALVCSGFPLYRFYYRGFLPLAPDSRQLALRALRHEMLTTIIMETPYRMLRLMEELAKELESDRKMALCFELTTVEEQVWRGTSRGILEQLSAAGIRKGEFVLVLSGCQYLSNDS
jgi:16S rRNA (cytidine1402-2'-O)-methyltransferase